MDSIGEMSSDMRRERGVNEIGRIVSSESGRMCFMCDEGGGRVMTRWEGKR